MNTSNWKDKQIELKILIEKLDLSSLIVHSDAFKSLSYIDFDNDNESNLRKHIEFILSLSSKITLPSFNYDFPRTRFFDHSNFISQVGAIPEFYRNNYDCMRTIDPMFSLIQTNASQLPTYQKEVCTFEKHGHFEGLSNKGAGILCYGTNIKVVTLIHYVESLLKVDYRYEKSFKGEIMLGSEIHPMNYTSHFRPWGEYMDYDWVKIGNDLKENEVMYSLNKHCHLIDAQKLLLYWTARIENDKLYLLDKKSKDWVVPKLEEIGRSFRQTDFEV